jgi:hypothetical protein
MDKNHRRLRHTRQAGQLRGMIQNVMVVKPPPGFYPAESGGNI